MNIRIVAGLFVLALSTTAGCGDDGGEGGHGGSGGAGGIGVTGSGTGGSGATSTGSNGGAEPTGTGGAEPTGTGGAEPAGTGGAEPTGTGGAEPTGTGGAEPTGTGGAEPTGTGGAEPTGTGGAEPTGGTGGSGGASSHVYGAACTSDATCPEDYCITEADWGWPSGSCAGLCDPAVGACSEDGVCIDFGEGLGLCVFACSRSDECRDGYKCSDVVGGITACVPACTENAQCPALGMCDTLDGRCVLGETECTDGVDNEGDDLVDCEDDDCDSTCGPLVDAACADAAPVATTTVEGDTSRGTRVFEGSCMGSGPEEVHLFTPPAGQSGTLRVELHSDSDHVLYARTACADGLSELDCQDESVATGGGPEEEKIEIVLRRGQTVPIFVDAYAQEDAGPYTLDFLFSPTLCGDRTVDPPEECDDGNTTSGDGCSAECTLELDAVCGDALVAVLGDNEGDTTTGTSLFEGSCLGYLRPEKIHTFTPPSDGTLLLRLSSDTDLGMYVRTSCVDDDSQVECMDNVGDDSEEVLEIDVDGGVPLFIFVDTYFVTDAGPYTLNLAFTPAP
ncbi:DUF4215 domain-containing protein [Sorangium sp. So ce1153]|uniref:DUF4215 domain-containing protein n=1 Tax=Sorangium sp. So ce1153 TaxID=3133333 RepID=UPI003F6031A3